MTASLIDDAILSATGERWTKVAMVIARVTKAMAGGGLPLGDEGCEAIAKRIETLVRDGRLVAQGDLTKWRFSEIRRVQEAN